MQYNKILKYFLFVIFIGTISFTISESAFAKNETLAIIKENRGVVSDSISKSEIADYRKNFEAVEKQIASKRGTYDDAKRSFNGISGSRVRNLPEFAGRFSSMQSKLTAWNLEVNPKQPPVVVPGTPKNPKNPVKTNNGQAEEEKNVNENIRKSLMLSYFPDTMSVGTDFLAYIEISKDNMMKFGNLNNNNNNSGIDSIVISSSALRTAVMNTQVTVELSKDGGADNFSINSRDSKMKTISDNGSARWEWLLSPNAAGDGRLRLSVTYQKQNKDGTMQDVAAMNKVIVVKGLAKKNTDTASNNMLWIILGVVVVLVIIVFVLLNGRKNKNNQTRVDTNNRNDRQDVNRNDVNRNNRNDVDRDTRL